MTQLINTRKWDSYFFFSFEKNGESGDDGGQVGKGLHGDRNVVSLISTTPEEYLDLQRYKLMFLPLSSPLPEVNWIRTSF